MADMVSDMYSGGSSADNKIKKTRRRVPTSCSVCRKRKMRCDKTKPFCSSCRAHGTTDLCIYETQPWFRPSNPQEGNSQLLDEIANLQDRIKQLEAELEDRDETPQSSHGSAGSLHNVNSHSSRTTSSGISNHLPSSSNTSPSSIEDNDPLVDLTEKFDVLVIKEEKLMHFGATSYMSLVQNDPILLSLFTKYLRKQKEKYEGVIFSCGADDEYGLKLSSQPSSIHPELKNKYNDVIADINRLLPPKRVTDMLVDRFFSTCYNFVPFVDEKSFREELELVLTEDSDGRSYLVVPHHSILSTVCILLIMLRFAFLTLPIREFSNGTLKEPADSTVAKLCTSGITIGPIYIEHAKTALLHAGVLRKVSIKNIQAIIFLRIYRMHSPEDGDEGLDSTVLVSMIIQMARAHGLYRDPERFDYIVPNEGYKHVWRKIWYSLLYLDSFQAICFGCPLIISEKEYDTQLPFIQDYELFGDSENYVVRFYKLQYQCTKIFRKVTQLSGNISKPAKRSDIEEALKEVDGLLNSRMRTFDQLFNSSDFKGSKYDSIGRAQECCLRLALTLVNYILHYILFLTCEPHETELAQKYSHLAAEKAFILFRIGHEFLSDTSSKFGSDLETIIAPYILLCSQRAIQMIFSISIRSNFGLFSLVKSIKDFKSIDSVGLVSWLDVDVQDENKMARGLISRVESFHAMATRLSYKYFHCWRLCMIIKLFLVYLNDVYPELGKGDMKREQPTNVRTTDGDALMEDDNQFWTQFLDESGQHNFDYFTPAMDTHNGDPFLNDTQYGINNIHNPSFSLGIANLDQNLQAFSNDNDGLTNVPSEFSFSNLNTPNFKDFREDDSLSQTTKVGMDIARSMFGGST